MKTQVIWDEDKKGFTRINMDDKVEKVNPIEYYENLLLHKNILDIKDSLNFHNPLITSSLSKDFFKDLAIKYFGNYFDKIKSIEVHKNFLELLTTSKKSDQIKLLREQSINPDQLMSLIYKSYNDFGMLYSKYLFENLGNSVDENDLPQLIHLDKKGYLKKVGETNMTDGQLKNVINHRKSIVAHFIEKEDLWHCFFATFRSIRGEENWKNGQPHFHYISSSFNISKNEFIESLENGKYKATSIHIDLLDYGNQPKQ